MLEAVALISIIVSGVVLLAMAGVLARGHSRRTRRRIERLMQRYDRGDRRGGRP